jgi:hypothetical protein
MGGAPEGMADMPTPEESKEMERRQRDEDARGENLLERFEEAHEGRMGGAPVGMGGAEPEPKRPSSLRPQRPSRFDEKPTIAEMEKGQPVEPKQPVGLKQPPWKSRSNSININSFVPEQGTSFPIESASQSSSFRNPPKPFSKTPYIDSIKPAPNRLGGGVPKAVNPNVNLIDSDLPEDISNQEAIDRNQNIGVPSSSIYEFNPNSKSLLQGLEKAEKNRMLNKYMNEATLMSSQPSSIFKGGGTDIYDQDDYEEMGDDNQFAMGGAEQTKTYVPNLFNVMQPSAPPLYDRPVPRNPLSDLRPRQAPPPYSYNPSAPPWEGSGYPVDANPDAYGVVPPRGSAPIDPMIGGVALPQPRPRQVLDDWKNQQEDRFVPRNEIDNALRDFNLNQGRMDGRRLSELSDIYSGSIINRDNLLGGGSISAQIANNLANSAGKGDKQGDGLYGEEGGIYNNTDVPNPRTLDQRFAQLGVVGGNNGGNNGGGNGPRGGFNLGGRGANSAGKFVNLKNRNMTYSSVMGVGGIPMPSIKDVRSADIPYQQPNQTIKGNALNLIRRSNQRSILNNNEYMP